MPFGIDEAFLQNFELFFQKRLCNYGDYIFLTL